MRTFWEARLAWAVRSWDAEVEIAKHLATRVNLVLTIALAFSGAGIKLLGDALIDRPAGFWNAALLVGSAIGLLLMFGAFIRVLVKRHAGRPAFASHELLPPESEADDPVGVADWEVEAAAAVRRSFLSTTAATWDLHARNVEEKRRTNEAQQLLLLGAVLTLVCSLLYTWKKSAAVASVPRDEGFALVREGTDAKS